MLLSGWTLQSAKGPLYIEGSGFKGEPVIDFVMGFNPEMPSPADYTVTVESESRLKLELVKGSMWSNIPSELLVKGINVGDGYVRQKARVLFLSILS